MPTRIPRSRLPLVPSRRLTRALERLGCYQGEGHPRGSHVAYHREVDGRILTAVVVLGKREVARGTLQDILYQLEIGLDEFRRAL